MADREISKRLEDIEADVASLQYLIEVLFVWRFKGQLDFEKFQKGILSHLEAATVPVGDPALSDHLSQLSTERMGEILARIQRRLKNPEGKGRPPKTDG